MLSLDKKTKWILLSINAIIILLFLFIENYMAVVAFLLGETIIFSTVRKKDKKVKVVIHNVS